MRYSARTHIAYGLSGLPLAVLGLPLVLYLPGFYAQAGGVPLATLGAVLLIARLIDVISDPLIGLLSDRWRCVLGRRKGMMLLGLPLLLTGVEHLFNPSLPVDAPYLLVWTLLAYIGWTLITIPYNAWGAELSRHYHERSRLAASREGFVILGTLGALALPLAFGVASDAGAALELIATFTWVCLPLSLLMTIVFVPEPATGSTSPPWRDGLVLLARNKVFLRLITAYTLNAMANALPATLFLLYAREVLDAANLTGVFLGVYFLAGVCGLPLWLAVAKRINKHRAWTFSMLLACLAFAFAPWLGPGDSTAFFLVCLVSGLSLGADMALPAAMQADVVDVDRRLGGGERAGLFFGLWGMATKLALALAVGIAFPVLALAGFEAGGANDASAVFSLALLYGALPVLIKLIAAALIWRFTLDEDALLDVQAATTDKEPDHDHAHTVEGISHRNHTGGVHGHEA